MHLCSPLAVTEKFDILIIGAGLIGLCTADALSARGAQVAVIDGRPGPCEGTSFSNSGMIHPSQAMSWEPSLSSSPEAAKARLFSARATARLGERSKEALLQKMADMNIPPREPGCRQVFSDMDAARDAQTRYAEIGVEAHVLDPSEETFGLAACHFPNDTSADARVFGCALAEDLQKRGVSCVYGAEEQAIRRGEDGFSVRTEKGIFQANHLVVAAGVRSSECLAHLGLTLDIKSVAGAAADFDLPYDDGLLPACPIMDAQSRSALTIFADRVRISGGWGVDAVEPLLARWTDIAPNIMRKLGVPRMHWSGLRPVSQEGRPYISGTSIPKLWVNTGHGHMGWTLCTGSGELMAQMILDGKTDRQFEYLARQ